jgi:hypothetical protein
MIKMIPNAKTFAMAAELDPPRMDCNVFMVSPMQRQCVRGGKTLKRGESRL